MVAQQVVYTQNPLLISRRLVFRLTLIDSSGSCISMTIKEGLYTLLPNTISFDELGALIMICDAIKSKDNSLRVTDKDLTNYLGFGRDKNDMVLTSLEEKGFIRRNQQRDPEGNFSYNLIRVTTDQIEL